MLLWSHYLVLSCYLCCIIVKIKLFLLFLDIVQMSFLYNFRRNQCNFLFNMIILRNHIFCPRLLLMRINRLKSTFYRSIYFGTWRLRSWNANWNWHLLILIINRVSDYFIVFDFFVYLFYFLRIIAMFGNKVIFLCF